MNGIGPGGVCIKMYKLIIKKPIFETALAIYCNDNVFCNGCPLKNDCLFGPRRAVKDFGEEKLLEMFKGIIEKEEENV